MATYINQIFLGVFLLVNLIVGLRASRGIKNMDEYALANRGISGLVLVITLTATLVDPNIMFIKMSYRRGIIMLLHPLALGISSWLLGYVVFPKLMRFEEVYTMPSIMGKMYGVFARWVAVLVATLFSLFTMTAHIITFGEIASVFGFSAPWFILSMGLLITIYTCLGGVRAVSMTDVLQFMVVLIGFVCFFIAILYYGGGLSSMLDKLPTKKKLLSFSQHPKFVHRLYLAFFWDFWPVLLLTPPIIQRVLMTRHRQHIGRMFASFSIYYFLLQIVLLAVGFALWSAEDVPKSSKKLTLDKIVKLVSDSSIAQLLFVLAMCAIIMSSVDSFLNALGIIWVTDVLVPLGNLCNKRIDAIRWTRICSFLLGCACTLYASYACSAKRFEVLGYGWIVFSSITVPFVMGVLGFSCSPRLFAMTILSFAVMMLFLLVLYHIDQLTLQKIIPFHDLQKSTGFKTMRVFWAISITISTFTYMFVSLLERILAKTDTNDHF